MVQDEDEIEKRLSSSALRQNPLSKSSLSEVSFVCVVVLLSVVLKQSVNQPSVEVGLKGVRIKGVKENGSQLKFKTLYNTTAGVFWRHPVEKEGEGEMNRSFNRCYAR